MLSVSSVSSSRALWTSDKGEEIVDTQKPLLMNTQDVRRFLLSTAQMRGMPFALSFFSPLRTFCERMTLEQFWTKYWDNYCEKPQEHLRGDAPVIAKEFMACALDNIKYDNDLTTWSSGWRTYRTVLALLFHGAHSSYALTDPIRIEYHTLEVLGTQISDREIPIGTIAQIARTNYRVEAHFAGKGAFITAFSQENDPTHLYLACRGTATNSDSTGAMASVCNDLHWSAGTSGVRAVKAQVLQFIRERGFSEITVVGKSLGGAMAQQLAVIIELSEGRQRVRKLITLASIGSGGTESLLTECVHRRAKKGLAPFAIRSYRIEGDFAPTTGGHHLGYSLVGHSHIDIQMHYVATHRDICRLSQTPENGLSALTRLWNSLPREHTHQMTLEKHFEIEAVPLHDLRTELSEGARTESMRQALATSLYVLSFGGFGSDALTLEDLEGDPA